MSEEIPVGVSYRVHDEGASKAADHIGKSLDHAGHASHGLRHKLGELRQELGLTAPALLGVGFGLGMWVEKAKEANAEFGRTKRAVASTLAIVLDWDKGTTVMDRYQRSTKLATEVTEKLEDVHARFGSSLEELGNAYRTVSISAGPLKMSQEQLLTLTTQAAAASKLFGVSGEDAAMRIGNALLGRVRQGGDAFNRFLGTMLGNVKKVSREKVFEGMSKQLERLVPMADQASQGIGDSMRRIQHQVEQLFEKASSPLFREIASSLRDAAKEAEKFGASGRPLVEEYADKLVEAFRELKKITGFLFDNWKKIAGIWVGMKAVNLGTSLAGAMAGGAGGKGAKLGGFIKGTSIPIISAAAGYALEEMYSTYEEGRERMKTAESLRGAFTGMREVNQGRPENAEASFGQISTTFEKAGVRSKEQALAMLDGLTESTGLRGVQAKTSEILGMSLDELKHLRQDLVNLVKTDTIKFHEEEDADAKIKTTGKAPINIANATFKFEFENTDPDRVFIRVSDELERMGNQRRSAVMPPGVE